MEMLHMRISDPRISLDGGLSVNKLSIDTGSFMISHRQGTSASIDRDGLPKLIWLQLAFLDCTAID
jgi:hypothetical protein